MECIVAIAMYAIAWPFACSRNGDSWREAERDDTDGGHLSRCTREKYRPMRMENILLGVGPILMIEVERDLTFDCANQCAMQSLSGRKTESYFTDTNLIKTCKLLNLFRYHCNAPSLQAKLPSQLSAFGPGQIQRASLPPKKRALRTSTCVAMRFHLRRGGFPLIVIGGFPCCFHHLFIYLAPQYLCRIVAVHIVSRSRPSPASNGT